MNLLLALFRLQVRNWSIISPSLTEKNISLLVRKQSYIGRCVSEVNLRSWSFHLNSDPENTLYDALYLNRGVKATFLSFSTAFAFLDRMTKEKGMTDLLEVLSKWSEGRILYFEWVEMNFAVKNRPSADFHGFEPIPKQHKKQHSSFLQRQNKLFYKAGLSFSKEVELFLHIMTNLRQHMRLQKM